jgi:hypothetical protein
MSTDVVWILLLIVPPGLCASAAVRSAGVSPSVPTALTLIFSLGYTVTGGVALVLALLGSLSVQTFLLGLAFTCLCLIAFAWRHRSPHAWRALVASIRPRRRRLELGFATVALICLSALRVDPAINLQFAGRWRYWADAREIALLGGIPHTTTQWSAHYEPTISKVFLDAFTAGFSSVAGSDAVSAYGALYVLGALGTAVALWALAWELGLRVTSALVPLLCAAPVQVGGISLSFGFATHIGLYKAEQIGRMVAFSALALAVHGLRTRATRPLLLSGVLLGVAALTHGVAASVVVILGCSYAVAWGLVTQRWKDLARSLTKVFVPAAATAAAITLAAGGDLGFSGAAGRYVPFDGMDPTALFAGKLRPLRDGHYYDSPQELLQRFGEAAAGPRPSVVVTVLASVALACIGLLGARLLRHRIAPLPATAVLFSLLIVVVALIFSMRMNAYEPATFGPRRLFDYANLAVLLLLLPWVENAFTIIARGYPRAALTTGIALVVIVGAMVGYRLQPQKPGQNARQLADAMNAVQTHVPCGARILPNIRSNATFESLAGRESVLEGMAPYLRPSELTQVLQLLGQARQALAGSPGSRQFLLRKRIAYVVLLRRRDGLISPDPSTRSWTAMDGLRLTFRDDNVAIYRVEGVSISANQPPGYDCNVPIITT